MPEHYILENDGKIIRRSWHDQAIRVDNSLQEMMCKDICVKAPLFSNIEGSRVGLTLKGQWTIASLHLTKLHLRCPWVGNPDNTISPAFNVKEPILEVDWNPAPDMDLVLVMRFLTAKNSLQRPIASRLEKTYLFALHTDKKAYKLPLANLYADCAMCTGLGSVGLSAPYLTAAISQLLEVIKTSVWRNDLLPNSDKVKGLFRFTPLGNGFRQEPPVNPWTTYCEVIGSPVLEEIA